MNKGFNGNYEKINIITVIAINNFHFSFDRANPREDLTRHSNGCISSHSNLYCMVLSKKW
jgi:hypothetical protein